MSVHPRSQWQFLIAIMVFCLLFWLAVAYAGLLAARAFSPVIAESLSFHAHGADRTPGEERVLSRGATAFLPNALAATDREALFELLDDIIARDTSAQEELVRAGRVVAVNDGTLVRVLGSQPAAGVGALARVQLLEGEHAGEAVWVPVNWLEVVRP